MRAILLIAHKDLRLLARDHMALFWVFVFPVGFALFFGSIMKAGVDADVAPLTVALVMESDQPIAEKIEHALSDAGLTTRHSKLDDARRAVQRGEAVAYVRVSDDPAADIELGIDPSRAAQGSMLQGLVRSSFMPQMPGLPAIVTTRVEQHTAGPNNGYEIVLPGMLIWGLIGCVATFAIALVTERTTGTLLRLRAAPISRLTILAGKSLACALTCVVDLCVLSLVGLFGFGIGISDPLKYITVLLACTACFTGLMMSLSVIGKTEQAVSGAGWSSLIVLAMIGGAMVPPAVMPEWLLRLSNLSPVRWGIWALEGATWRALSWHELLQPLCMLSAFGVAAFAAGAGVMALWREL
ncbi:MAG TPA: ABC transporter permease [Polyangiales bacterium]|jgi:ABC-type multidrug transport system permease subunit|nr:ABC transporter permease [Polyangiales bacterium]